MNRYRVRLPLPLCPRRRHVRCTLLHTGQGAAARFRPRTLHRLGIVRWGFFESKKSERNRCIDKKTGIGETRWKIPSLGGFFSCWRRLVCCDASEWRCGVGDAGVGGARKLLCLCLCLLPFAHETEDGREGCSTDGWVREGLWW